MATASIVIPAHNEANVIERCLSALTPSAGVDEFRVVVVCNGCSDDTAARARRFGGAVEVVEISRASKPAALNQGDAVAGDVFPRLYLDADIEMTASSARAVVKVLDAGALAAAPSLHLDLSRASRVVRSYYAVWTQLGYVREGLIGSGVYGLSRAGRDRFGAFPDLVADDLYVHSLFAPSERATAPDSCFVVRPPRTVRNLVRTKTRVFAGNRELLSVRPTEGGQARGGPQVLGALRRLDRHGWAGLPAYMLIQGVAKMRAADQDGPVPKPWARDDSSRVAPDGDQ